MKNPKRDLLQDEFPDFFNKLVRPVRPEVDAEKLTSGSGEKVIWKCNCGLEFVRAVYLLTRRKNFRCNLCSNAGKSRVEFEIASLLRVYTGYEVKTHYGDKHILEVDLYLPQLDLAIQIDPYYTHVKRFEVDKRMSAKMQEKFTDHLRVREEGLENMSNSVYLKKNSSAVQWTLKICGYLKIIVSDTDMSRTKQALTEANEAWDSLFSDPLPNSLATIAYSNEFVKNLTHPGRKTEYTPIKCSDRFIWKCFFCQEEWDCSLSTRKNGLGCSKCAYITGGRKKATPQAGSSLADLHPAITHDFVENLSHQERTPALLKPTSGDICLWRCLRGHEQRNAVDKRIRASGCGICMAKYQLPKNRKSLLETYFRITQDFVHNTEDLERIPTLLLKSSRDICLWKCLNCGHLSKNSVLYQVGSYGSLSLTGDTCLHKKQKMP